MRGWRTSSSQITAGIIAALMLAACGSGARQDATEPQGHFPVSVDVATFPTSQTIAQSTHLVLAVRNSGHRVIPDIAITICNVTCTYPAPAGEGTSAQAFAADISAPYLANASRPLWVIDQSPGPCQYSCHNGGLGAGATAYSNTWALGRLAPGQTARFAWKVTSVAPGRHVVAWEVAAGLNGRARAIGPGGMTPGGTFVVNVSAKPQQSYVDSSGKIVSRSASSPGSGQ